eukprot:CAMPEP_0116555280 /NCGR_PEP_ID=MMETSP0397-20121206/8066_1 /TAXON_ID=216820 /ORGANISM="Cyclophora tenuis, Strain ECT3854" /LENGTH=277 /DNA_ID=CAMNT_0004080547 /DNA_START=26 /DNA_END=859 /DNA_ORIENTATION=+
MVSSINIIDRKEEEEFNDRKSTSASTSSIGKEGRSVRFDEEVRILDNNEKENGIDGMATKSSSSRRLVLTPEELESCFYTEQELQLVYERAIERARLSQYHPVLGRLVAFLFPSSTTATPKTKTATTTAMDTDRGLEGFTHYHQTRRAIDRGIDTVLREQYKLSQRRQLQQQQQHQNPTDDLDGSQNSYLSTIYPPIGEDEDLDEYIATKYREATRESQLHAVYRARLDERLALADEKRDDDDDDYYYDLSSGGAGGPKNISCWFAVKPTQRDVPVL